MTSQARTAHLVTGWCGLAAVAVYAGATVLGGIIDPAYSHVRDAISALTAAGAPTARLWPLYALYNVLLAGFAIALYRSSAGGRLLLVARRLFVIGSLAGIGEVTLFPQDQVGGPSTPAGTIHLVLAGVSSILTVACAVLYWRGFRTDDLWRPMSRLSLVCAIVILSSAPAAVISVGGPFQGVFERLTIGVFMAWIVILSGFALLLARGLAPDGPAPEAHMSR